MSESLDTAIANAAKELQTKAATGAAPPAAEPEPEPELEVQETETEESAEAEPPETDATADAEDLSAQELLESKNLYKALKDPSTRSSIVAALAQQAGLLLTTSGKPPSEAQTEKAAKTVQELLADSLGKEYSFLAPKLGPAIEAVLNQERETQNARFAEIQQSNVEREVVVATEKIAQETKGASKVFEARMAALSEEIPIGNLSVEKYVRNLYVLASNERRTSPQKVADQIRRNSAGPERLRTSSAGAPSGPQIPDKKMSLDESVRWASDQLLRKGQRKS